MMKDKRSEVTKKDETKEKIEESAINPPTHPLPQNPPLQTVRLDSGVSPAEMLFGQALWIPGDLCAYEEPEVDIEVFLNEFRRYLSQVKAVTAPHHSKKTPPTFKPFYYKDLNTCTHVLKLVKKVKSPLIRPYTGPHKVIERHPSNKYFKIDINGKAKVVSTDLLKPAYFIPEDLLEYFPEYDYDPLFASEEENPLPPPPLPDFYPLPNRIIYPDLAIPTTSTSNTATPNTTQKQVQAPQQLQLPQQTQLQQQKTSKQQKKPQQIKHLQPKQLQNKQVQQQKESKEKSKEQKDQSKSAIPAKKVKFVPNILKRRSPNVVQSVSELKSILKR